MLFQEIHSLLGIEVNTCPVVALSTLVLAFGNGFVGLLMEAAIR